MWAKTKIGVSPSWPASMSLTLSWMNGQIPTDIIQNLIEGHHRRIQAGTYARGGPIQTGMPTNSCRCNVYVARCILDLFRLYSRINLFSSTEVLSQWDECLIESVSVWILCMHAHQVKGSNLFGHELLRGELKYNSQGPV